jgi:hypothetical protein
LLDTLQAMSAAAAQATNDMAARTESDRTIVKAFCGLIYLA